MIFLYMFCKTFHSYYDHYRIDFSFVALPVVQNVRTWMTLHIVQLHVPVFETKRYSIAHITVRTCSDFSSYDHVGSVTCPVIEFSSILINSVGHYVINLSQQ